ncbi:Carboxylesterase [Actinidia chinensis var. chinensis]|uniref:Carboxylesterase n=1 Tax=Actinidia chinensis var. chinensis TaxID=1590841 RepID=A0A2R6R3E8_ACTCC|nr:Carboxylesterase [Actinidia chinensis var. chinensis]
MDSSRPEVSHEVPPYLRVYKNGTIERLFGNEVAPASFDPQTGVESKDTMITPEAGVFARLYRPSNTPNSQKLPLVVYFHGGAFFISSISDPKYHHSLNVLVAKAKIILISVDYRRAPEHPLPAAYEDSWAALQWVASHASGGGVESWLKGKVDFSKVFLAGDSAGANISHHLAIRAGSNPIGGMKLHGIIMIHPYFWGEKPIGSEAQDPMRKAMVDGWWRFVCPSDRGNDDPLINPVADGAPSLSGMACNRVIVCVAGKDILRDRGRLYYESLVKSEWLGKAVIVEIEGEDHVFHILDPNCEKALYMTECLASFINQE